MDRYLYLIPLLPLLAATFNLLVSGGRWLSVKAHSSRFLRLAGSWILSLLVFNDLYDNG